MPVPTWRLAAVAALGAVVVLFAPLGAWPTFLVVNAVVVVAAASDWLRAARPAALGVERELPAVVGLDQPDEITWRVTNRTSRSVTVRLADELAPSLRPERRRAELRVPAGATVAARTGIRPSRRGRFTPAEVTLRVEGPWGLMTRQGRRSLPATLRVYPPFRSRAEAELRINRARLLEAGLRSVQQLGGGTDFEGLRDYGPDDEFRRIDWAATARANRAIVRTYRAERNQTVLTLLDSGRVMAGLVGSPQAENLGHGPQPENLGHGPQAENLGHGPQVLPRLDYALDAAMMLTAVSTGLGDRAGLVAFADDVRSVVAPGHAHGQLARVTEALYDLEPRLVESDYRGAFAETLARFRRRALLVVLTELAREAVTETLLPALPLVVRDHLVVVAGIRDPAVDAWARAVPTESGAAYRKAAAVQALADRREVVARLRGLGVTVVDASPSKLAGQLADAYLRVKATGRL